MSDVRSEPGGVRAGRGFGLRSRLVVAFVAVAALTAAVTFTLTLSYSTIYTLHAGFPYWRESVKQRREIFRHSWFPIVSGGEIAVYVVVAAVVLVVLIGVVCWVATRRVLSPVRQLAVAADRLAGGDLGVRLRPVGGDELAQLVGRFNSMAGSLERSVEELSEMEYRARRFAGDVTHELRTPLAAMVAVTDVLDEHAVAIAGDGGRAARLVSDEIRNLNRLVETLIEVSRFDAGTAGLVVDDLDVAAAVERCLAARGWAGSVVVDVPAGLRGELDSRRFDVIVANLVANAASHGRPPVIVWARTESSDDGMCLTVGVRDHGPGIPVGVLPHVFERFYKADSARGRSAGSGLGLAIARENARLHGGDIRAENLPDGGAVFLVTLPLPLPLPRPVPVRPAMSDVRSEPGGARAGRGFGLRSRLVVAFVAVAALTAAVTFTLTLSYSTIYDIQVTYSPGSQPFRRQIFRHSWFPILSGGEIAVYVVVAAVVLVVLIGVVCWVATRRVLSPVRQLAVAADRLAGGDLGVRLRPVGGDELAQLVGRFNSMAGSLERSVEELSEMEYRARRFAGDVTHELRTPLAAMVAVTDVLDEHAVAIAGDGGRAARLVSDEIRNLNRLVETLIEVSRFDAGTAGLVVDDLDVAAAVERCLAARGWAGSVVVDVPAGLRGELDSRRFDVIVANLVANAASHGRPPVIVWARTESSDDGMCLTVGVRDHGPGIPVGVLPHVFERFYKADSARGRSAGSGLGLAIARENARLHGGDIRAENLPDGGAVFLVTLPLPLPLPRLAPDCYQTVTSS